MEEIKDISISQKLFNLFLLLTSAVFGVAVPVILTIGYKIQPIYPKIIYVCIYHAILCSVLSIYAKKKSGY